GARHARHLGRAGRQDRSRPPPPGCGVPGHPGEGSAVVARRQHRLLPDVRKAAVAGRPGCAAAQPAVLQVAAIPVRTRGWKMTHASHPAVGRFTRCLAAAVLVAAPWLPALAQQAPAPLLHTMFQDHAVLQRDQPLRVWGLAPPGETVRIELAGRSASARAGADGRWQAALLALEAGGPHTLVASAGKAQQTVSDLLVGDVWLCSGQSNMELQVWRSLDARAEIASAGNDRIRLLTVPQVSEVSAQATFSRPVQWRPVDSESVRDFSAACYFYARELQKTVDVPMGLVNAAWGGSRIEPW